MLDEISARHKKLVGGANLLCLAKLVVRYSYIPYTSAPLQIYSGQWRFWAADGGALRNGK